jgi:hypothetical protein
MTSTYILRGNSIEVPKYSVEKKGNHDGKNYLYQKLDAAHPQNIQKICEPLLNVISLGKLQQIGI